MTSEADTQAAATSTGKGASHPTDPAASLPKTLTADSTGLSAPRALPSTSPTTLTTPCPTSPAAPKSLFAVQSPVKSRFADGFWDMYNRYHDP